MTAPLPQPRRLRWEDDLSGFASGSAELDGWLEHAWDAQRASEAVTFAVVVDGVVLGYYAMTMAVYATIGSRGQDQVARTPVVLVPRLAVTAPAQGRGLGAVLLRHAIEQAVRVSEAVGAAALVVHTPDASARAFYLANGDFVQSPVEPMHLMLSMAEVRRRLREDGSHDLVVPVRRATELAGLR